MEVEIYHVPGQYVYLDMYGLKTLLDTVEFTEPNEVSKALRELVEAHRAMKEIEHEIRRAIASGKIKINNEIRRALEEIRKNEYLYNKYVPESSVEIETGEMTPETTPTESNEETETGETEQEENEGESESESISQSIINSLGE